MTTNSTSFPKEVAARAGDLVNQSWATETNEALKQTIRRLTAEMIVTGDFETLAAALLYSYRSSCEKILADDERAKLGVGQP